MKCGRHMLWGTLIVLTVGALMHFAFEWLGGLPLLGLVFPVNESPFEHLKIVFYPMILYWLIAAPRKGDLAGPLAAGTFASMLLTASLFYLLKGGFAIESLAVDIALMAFAVFAGQWLICLQLSCGAKKAGPSKLVGGLVLLAIAGALMLFTFRPPHLPFFLDPPSGGYGIDKQIGSEAGNGKFAQNVIQVDVS